MPVLHRVLLVTVFVAAPQSQVRAQDPSPSKTQPPDVTEPVEIAAPAGESESKQTTRIVDGWPPLYSVKRALHPLTWLELAFEPGFRATESSGLQNLMNRKPDTDKISGVRFGVGSVGTGSGFGPQVTFFHKNLLGRGIEVDVPLVYTYSTWKPIFPSVMFSNLTDEDAFWATRVILEFSEADLKSIIETAEYSDAKTKEYILATLLRRRQMVAQYWLGKVGGLSDFSISRSGDGVRVRFRDLVSDQKRAATDTGTEYIYEVKGQHYESSRRTAKASEIIIERAVLSEALEHAPAAMPIEVAIWTHRRDFTSPLVRIYFDWSPNRDALTIRRIARG